MFVTMDTYEDLQQTKDRMKAWFKAAGEHLPWRAAINVILYK